MWDACALPAGMSEHIPWPPHKQALQHVTLCSRLQGRLFVTRDHKLAMRRDVGGSVYLQGSNDAADQLEELKRHFGIK
jgi:uncharacterized protein with PIN domain